MFTFTRISSFTLVAILVAAPASAQQFKSPGAPNIPPNSGQTDGFSNAFNPAFGLVIDGIGDYRNEDRPGLDEEDGFDLQLRAAELTVQAWVDPSAWVYAVIVAEEGELELEEGAAKYVGLDSNATIKAGRFFVDFGKTMQTHLHDLRSVERPLAIRTYLGEELAGEGLQFDYWMPLTEEVPVRFSLGVFQALEIGEEDETADPVLVQADRSNIEDLSFTARATGFGEFGENGLLQLGMSVRSIPDFSLEADDGAGGTLAATGLSNTIYGADLTYGWTDSSATRSLTFGTEVLAFHGNAQTGRLDNIATPTAILVEDDTAWGYTGFCEYSPNLNDSYMLQFSRVERPTDSQPVDQELDLIYSRKLTEFQRLRLQLTHADSDLDGDSYRIALQYTLFAGSHAHGVDW